MARNAQIGWSTEAKLLHDINKKLERLIKLTGTVAKNTETTTTTTTT